MTTATAVEIAAEMHRKVGISHLIIRLINLTRGNADGVGWDRAALEKHPVRLCHLLAVLLAEELINTSPVTNPGDSMLTILSTATVESIVTIGVTMYSVAPQGDDGAAIDMDARWQRTLARVTQLRCSNIWKCPLDLRCVEDIGNEPVFAWGDDDMMAYAGNTMRVVQDVSFEGAGWAAPIDLT